MPDGHEFGDTIKEELQGPDEIDTPTSERVVEDLI